MADELYKKFFTQGFQQRASTPWDNIWRENPDYLGRAPNAFALFAGQQMRDRGVQMMVLDAGCGTGRDSLYFAGLDLETMALDFSEVAIKTIQSRVINTPLVTMVNPIWVDVLDGIPVSDDFFGAVYSFDFLNQDFTDEEIRFILEEFYRTMLPGALFFAAIRSTQDEEYGRGEPIGSNHFRLPDGRGLHFWSQEDVEQCLSEWFEIETLEEGQVELEPGTYAMFFVSGVK